MAVNLKSFARALAEKPLLVPGTRFKQCQRVLKTSKRSLAGVSTLVAMDPGLCMLVLRYVNRIREQSSSRIEINPVVSAVNLIGENGLRNLISSAPILENKISDPATIDSYVGLIDRSIHAAQFTKRWAKIRNDAVPGELEVAGLLRDMGELALCAHHYPSYSEIRRYAQERSVCFSRAASNILGFSTIQLGRELASRWHMPDVVRDGLTASRWELFRPQGVMLASECARVAESGWYHPDMVNCEEAISDYLNLGFDRVCLDLHKVTVAIARKGALHKPSRFASQLVQVMQGSTSHTSATPSQAIVNPNSAESRNNTGEKEASLKKQREQRSRIFALSAKQLKQQAMSGKCSPSDLIKTTLQGIYAGLNFKRVFFASINAQEKKLVPKLTRGIDKVTAGQFDIPYGQNSIFTALPKSQQCIWVNNKSRVRLKPLFPDSFLQSVGTDHFLVASVYIGNRPAGVIYADCRDADEKIDESMYQGAKSLIVFASKALAILEAKQKQAKKDKALLETTRDQTSQKASAAGKAELKKRA